MMTSLQLHEGEGRSTLISALSSPVRFAVRKYRDYKSKQRERARLNVTERELVDIQKKITRMLCTIDSQSDRQKQVTRFANDVTQASRVTSSASAAVCEQECVICLNAKATMRTEPCGHQVVCRRCFIATIQAAVTQRALPLKCVLCRTPILKLASSTGKLSSRPYITSPASRKVAPLDYRIANKITSTSTSNKKIAEMHPGSGQNMRAGADGIEVMEARKRCKWLTRDEAAAAVAPPGVGITAHQQPVMVPYLAIGGKGRHVIRRAPPPPSVT